MKYEIDSLLQEVRVVLDENTISTALADIGDVDTLSLTDIVKNNICNAARAVMAEAPHHLLDRGEPFATTIYWDKAVGEGRGNIQLPDDFLRLVTFQMSDWDRAVVTAITEEDPLYAMQSSRYGGIKGNPQKPVVAIVHRPDGLWLEFYSCTGGANVAVRSARYIPIPRVGTDSKIDISEKLKPAVVYYTAYLTALTLKDKELAEYMLAACKELMK